MFYNVPVICYVLGRNNPIVFFQLTLTCLPRRHDQCREDLSHFFATDLRRHCENRGAWVIATAAGTCGKCMFSGATDCLSVGPVLTQLGTVSWPLEVRDIFAGLGSLN